MIVHHSFVTLPKTSEETLYPSMLLHYESEISSVINVFNPIGFGTLIHHPIVKSLVCDIINGLEDNLVSILIGKSSDSNIFIL